jgi:hypothetical protein
VNVAILGLIIASYIANREGTYLWERRCAGVLVILVTLTTVYAILKLKQMQTVYDSGFHLSQSSSQRVSKLSGRD